MLGFCFSVFACGDDSQSGGGAPPSGGADSGGSGPSAGAAPAGGMGGSNTAGASEGGAEAGGAAAGGAPQGNPYTDCEMENVACPVPGSICPFDSTGSVCAPPCDTRADCPSLAGASNEPECFEVNAGTFCVIPCGSTAECPAGMECLFVGLTPQCGWP